MPEKHPTYEIAFTISSGSFSEFEHGLGDGT